jgi:hypothetical protein
VSYSEKDGQVILAMSREDYAGLLEMFSYVSADQLARATKKSKAELENTLQLLNRLNEGNPNYKPY